MVETEQCQERRAVISQEEVNAISVQCAEQAYRWSTCGAGCTLKISYCDSHGGSGRAAQEMAAHVEAEHQDA